MEEMIKRIVEMDKKAREITERARQEKIESEKEVEEKAAKLREEMLSRARRRIQINRELEKVIFEQEWSKKKARYDKQIKRIDQLAAKHGEEWVNTIFNRVLNDD